MVSRYDAESASRLIGIELERCDFRKRYTKRQKMLAHQSLSDEITSGHMPKAAMCVCVDCGKPAKHYDHYKGYSRSNRLCVQPVCVSCYAQRICLRGERNVSMSINDHLNQVRIYERKLINGKYYRVATVERFRP